MLISRTLASLVLVGVCSIASAAEDWPKWLGPRGDNISKENVAPKWPADGPTEIWAADVGEGYASPIAQDGKIYLFAADGKAETLSCFNADDGKVLWEQTQKINWTAQYPGTRATPTIEGDRIYTFGQAGDLVCRQLADGKQIWHVNALKETGTKPLRWGSASSPLIVADRIFVQTGEGGPIAVAVNKQTGKIEWKAEQATLAGYASMVLTDVKGAPELIVFSGNAVNGLDPATGKTIWSDAFATRYDVNAATPIVHDGKVLFTAEYDTGRAAMYELAGKDTKKVWENKNLKSRFQPVVLDDGFVYGNSEGTLVCINWQTGELAWAAKERDMRLGTGGSIVRAGDKLITMSERGKLSLVQATPKAYKLISQMELFDADQIWASPLLYDGKLYCKGRDQLVCLDASGK